MTTNKKYKVDVVNHQIHWFTFACEHPNHKGYVIVVNEFQQPVRMLKTDWDLLTITSYEDAKIELVKILTDAIESYK